MIRFALPSDFDLLHALYLKIAAAVENSAEFSWDSEKVSAEIRVARTLVFELNGEAISFVTFRELPDILEISALGTLPVYRKQGYLEALLDRLLEFAAQQNKTVWLEVHEQNRPAQQLYRKRGFILLKTRKNYYSDGASALIFTSKIL